MGELRSIGWVLQMSRASYLDRKDVEEEVYVVNLVRPVGNPAGAAGKAIFAERGPAFNLDDVTPLLFPWRWTKTWRLFGLKNASPPAWEEIIAEPEEPWTVETGTLTQAQIDDVKGFWDATECALMKRCKGFDHPLSGHPDDVEAREPDEKLSQSFVHAIAPFTHLVAPVSNAALGLAGFFRVPPDEVKGFAKLVLFPDVGLTDRPDLKVKKDSVEAWPNGPTGSVHALYEPDFKLPDGESVAVCFLSKVAEREAAAIAVASSPLKEAVKHPARWKIEPALEAAAHHLHPARMVAGVVQRATEWTGELNPDERDRWRRLLVQVLGLGWDRPRHDLFGGRAGGHVLDGTAKEPELLELVGATRWVDVLDPAWVGNPLVVLTEFYAFLKSSATPPIRRLFEQARLHDGHPVVEWLGDVVSQESDAFRSSWAKLVFTATDRDPAKALDLRLLWWLFGIDEKAHTRAVVVLEELVKQGADGDTIKDWKKSWEALRTKVLTRVIEAVTTRLGDRSMLGELDRLPAPICSPWDPLEEYVVSGQTSPLERWIAGWIWKDEDGKGWLAPPRRLSSVDCSHLCAKGGECYDPDAEKCDEACFEARCDALNQDELAVLTVEPIGHLDEFVKSSKPDRIRAKDMGFPLVIEVPEDAVDDQAIRGQAVVLRSGVRLGGEKPAWDDERAQWITDTTVAYKTGDSMKFLKRQASGAIWSTATVGASLSGGHRVVELVYEGGPACAAATTAAETFEAKDQSAELDYDGTEVLDYLWLTTERALPLLGYGMTYSTARTAIDNAGGIFDPDLRSDLAVVARPSPNFPYKELGAYLSWEPPGPPMLWVDDPTSTLRSPRPEDFALSAQTRAAQIERQRAEAEGTADPRDVPNVAFLRPFGSTLYQEHRPVVYELVIRPPGTHADFIERWLNTDILTLEKGAQAPGGNPESLLSDLAFKDARDDVIDLRNRLCKGLREKTNEQSAEDLDRDPGLYHPAVTWIGFEIDKLDGSEIERGKREIKRLTDYGVDKRPRRFVPSRMALLFRVYATDRDDDFKRQNPPESNAFYELELAPGASARVRFYSLVEDRFFEGNTSIHRYHEDVGEGRDELFPGYRAFGALELWFEVGPDVEDPPKLEDDHLRITAPTLPNPNLSQLQLQDRVVPAEWLRGLRITRHELHWTGYPVRYPAPEGSDIGDWLPSFAGVESAVDTKEVTLATELENGSWRVVPNQGVGRPRILHDGHRPAGYAGYTARPIVRFREWLRPGANPLKLEDTVLAVGALERGRAASPREARLLAPALTSGGPLTASFDAAERASGSLPERAPNGHLLILEEPLYDTMPSAVTGGIGEVIEVDLLETRKIKVTREAPDGAADPPGPDEDELRSFREIGPNPIFHQPPDLEEQAEMDIVASEPFGLTDDLVRNAKVRQTGIVLTPRNTDGRWTLAKIRARRMILPETLLIDPIPRDEDHEPYRLPLRPAGDENVPADFVIDATEAWTNPAIRVAGCARDLDLPAEVPAGHRLVCSWHKGRFETGQVSWRPQVILQEPVEGELRWKTLEKRTPYVQPDWEPVVALTPQESEVVGTRTGAVDLVLKPDLVDAVRPAHLSDYTEPEWVLFIGTFGRSEIGRADQYSLALRPAGAAADAPELELLGPEMPELTAPEECLQGPKLTFQLLHLYRPIESIAHGEPDRTGGVQVAVYAPRVAEDGTATSTFRCYSRGEDAPPPSLHGCYGYLLTYQRISVPSSDEREQLKKIGGWRALLSQALFPDQGGGWVEATVRPVPECLGPISILVTQP